MKEDKDFMNDDTMIDIGKDEKATLKDLINIYKNVKKNEDDEKMKDKKEEKNKLELEEKNRLELEEKNKMDGKERMKNNQKKNEVENSESFNTIKNAGEKEETQNKKGKFISISDRVEEGKARYCGTSSEVSVK